MLIHLPRSAPISVAYEAQKQLFETALDAAIQHAAQQVGSKVVADMFKIPEAKELAQAA